MSEEERGGHEALVAYARVLEAPGEQENREDFIASLRARNPLFLGILVVLLWLVRVAEYRGLLFFLGTLVKLLKDKFISSPWFVAAAVIVTFSAWGLALLAWLGVPILSTVLRFHPVGRTAITETQRKQSTFMTAYWLVVAAAFPVYITGEIVSSMVVAICLFALVIPFVVAIGEQKTKTWIGTTLLAVAALGCIYGGRQIAASDEAVRPLAGSLLTAPVPDNAIDLGTAFDREYEGQAKQDLILEHPEVAELQRAFFELFIPLALFWLGMLLFLWRHSHARLVDSVPADDED